jgi:hypothetical protein
MSNKLPTLKHTWQLDINNVAAIGGTNIDCYQRSLFQLKEALTGFATFPWTVHSSSNSINHTNDGIPVLAFPDDSTNSNDGTPNSMEATDIVTDVPGGSFSTGSTLFGGASFEYVSMGDATELKFADTDSFSISCWAKWTSAGAMSVVSKMQGSSLFTGYMLFVDAGHVDFFLINNFGAGQYIDVNTTATGFNDGAWHHIVVTYNGSSSASGIKIWVDGTDEPLTTNTDNLLASIDTTAVFAIANRPASVLPYAGNVDDVAVYDIALDGAQVATIYNSGIPNDLRIVGPTASLVGYWRMEGLPTGVADLWLSSTNLVWATAPAAHGWIILQHPTRNTQICFDLKNALGRHLAMFISYSGGYSGGDLTQRPRAEDEVFVATFTQWLGPLTGSFSSWVHAWHADDGSRTRAFVATSAGTSEGAFFLFDEIDTPSPNWEQREISMVAFHGGVSGGTVIDADRLVASNSFGTSNFTDFISGSNVIAFMGGPLKDTSISIFSEGSTVFNDRSTAETEYALIGDVGLFKFAHTDPFSISCWIRSQFAANQFIISKREGGGNLRGYALYADATGEIVCQLYNVTVSNAIDVSTSGADISDGLWHHIVMTYDGNVNASGVAIYVDGVAVATVANIDNLTATIDNTTGLQISGRAGAAGGYVGNIDDVAIYDKELSPEEVATIYNGGNAVIPFTTKGVVFDGVNELIDMGNVSELDFTHTDTYSVSGWLKWTTLIGGMPWAKQEDSTNYRGYMMFTGTSGEIGVIIRNTHLTNLLRVVTTATGFNTGIWRHVVFTYDGSTNASGVHIYVDGVDQPLTITDDTLSATTTNSVPFQLGARDSFSGPGSNDWFKGAMDDVAVYNKELSQAEVTAIYNFGNPRLNTLLPSASNLVGYWLMGDGASFPTILDASTNSNDGTMTNMESSDIVNNVPFVPTFISDGEPSDLRVDGPTSNLVGYWLMGDGDIFPTITDHSGNLNDATCTGMETEDMPFGDTPANPMVYTRLGFHMAGVSVGSGDLLHRGVAASVSNELDTKFPTITDLSLSGNDGTATNMEAGDITGDTPGGASSYSMTFDGVNEYVEVGDVTSLKFVHTDPFSFSVWAKWTSLHTGALVAKMTAAGTFRGYQLSVNAGSGQIFLLLRNTITTNYLQVNTNTGGWNDGSWHHIVATYDGSTNASGCTIYIDGAAQTLTTTSDTLSATIDETVAFRAGARDSATSQFNGQLDDVAVYDKELLLAEVQAIYNSGVPADNLTLSTVSNLVGYWTMGDDAGSPAYPIHPISLMADYGYNGFHGFIDDLWWSSLDLSNPSSSTFPNDPDNRQYAQVGEFTLPWTEDSTLPLLGGTGIVNDTYDLHFIDTSDLTGSGITKYFQMTGIDSGNPSQPAYHSWIVTDAPDPSGALAAGPDAPPFGGPLTNIVVSAEWTD